MQRLKEQSVDHGSLKHIFQWNFCQIKFGKGSQGYEIIISVIRKLCVATHYILYDDWSFQIIHISRNPKDVALSFYHYSINFLNDKKSFEESLDAFLAGDVIFHPFIEHHLGYWELEKQGYPNILYLTFEEMKKDLDSVIRKTMRFLGKDYPSEKLDQLEEHLSFENMKKNPYTNQSDMLDLSESNSEDRTIFMRKGQTGGYKEEMSEEYIKKFDEWIEEKLKGKDHRFDLI
jgi:hypothetical protein